MDKIGSLVLSNAAQTTGFSVCDKFVRSHMCDPQIDMHDTDKTPTKLDWCAEFFLL